MFEMAESIKNKDVSLVKNIMKVCKEEKRRGKTLIPLERCTERVANYSGLSIATVVRFNGMNLEEKKERKERSDKVVLDSFDRDVVRRTVFKMIEDGLEVPTAKSIHKRLKEAMDFKWSLSFLRKILKEIGFVWRRCGTNRNVLMERTDITVARLRYLRKVKQLREEGRTIVFTDETYVHTTHSVNKCWQSEDVLHKIPFTRGERFIIVHAGSEKGFINGAALVFKSGQASGDYHNDMNGVNFQKWTKEKLIPNLPENSVLIVDNAPYHNLQLDKCPTQNTRKADIAKWLQRNNISYADSMLKPELLELCRKYKPEPKYILDELLREHGHECLRLPPYHAELNAIELIWSQVKGRIARANMSFTSSSVKDLIDASLGQVTEEDWAKCCRHVQEKEEEFWKSNAAIERAVESFIIDLTEDDETDTASECEDYSDTDSAFEIY